MEAAHHNCTAAAVRDLDRALATLGQYRAPGRRLDTACLTLESAKELLCDERPYRAIQLLQHARKVLRPVMSTEEIAAESGVMVTRYLDSALSSLGL
jgi:hypothetical protein